MLVWYKSNEEVNTWEGYEDDTILYTVTFDGVDAWEWVYLPENCGFHGYDSANGAMIEAEVDYKKNHLPKYTMKE